MFRCHCAPTLLTEFWVENAILRHRKPSPHPRPSARPIEQRTKRRRRSTRTAADARDGQYSGDRRSPGDVDHKYDHTGRQHDMDARKPDVDGRFKSRSGLGGFGQSVVGGSSSQSLYMDGSFGDGDGGGQNPGEVFTGGRWSGKMKGVNDQ